MPMELDDEQQEEEEKIANSEEEDREYSQSFQDVFWNEDLDSLLL
jgi:glycogen debranching enzyme